MDLRGALTAGAQSSAGSAPWEGSTPPPPSPTQPLPPRHGVRPNPAGYRGQDLLPGQTRRGQRPRQSHLPTLSLRRIRTALTRSRGRRHSLPDQYEFRMRHDTRRDGNTAHMRIEVSICSPSAGSCPNAPRPPRVERGYWRPDSVCRSEHWHPNRPQLDSSRATSLKFSVTWTASSGGPPRRSPR
jgi:hypothetical protein